jgi:hypothetical protein
MQRTKNAIQVKQIHATLEKFTRVLTDNPVGLHFSGHGIVNSMSTVGQDHAYMYKEGNCLVFETAAGSAHYISEAKLKTLLTATCHLRFVFIASCHS